MGINKLSETFMGFFVITSMIRKLEVKINDQNKPTKKKQIMKHVMHPASAPSHVLLPLIFIFLFPYRIPI